MRPAAIGTMLALVVPAGTLADPSFECSIGSGSQVETRNCLSEVEETVNETMRIALDFARSAAQELDDVTGRSVAVQALETSQQAWEAFRAAECDYAGALFGGGSGTGIEITSCRIALTRARTDALFARLP